MKTDKVRFGLTDLALVIISAVYLVGIRTLFSPCGIKEDGTWMTCHWAGQAVTGIAALLLVISLVRFLFPDAGVRMGLSAAMIPTAVLGALMPGVLIGLCMMDNMRCHSVMRPFTVIMSVLEILAAVLDMICLKRKRAKQ